MDRDKGIEARLKGTSVPRVVEGDHRARLKLALACRPRRKAVFRSVWESKLAWGCLAAALLVGGIWHRGTTTSETFTTTPHPVVVADGGDETAATDVVETSAALPPTPESPEPARENGASQQEEIFALIAKGEGEFLGETQSESGGKAYLYRVTLSDDTEIEFSTYLPINSRESRTVFENWPGIRSQSILTGVTEDESGEKTYLHVVLLPGDSGGLLTASTPIGAAKWSDGHLAELQGLIAEDRGEFLERKPYLNDTKAIDIYNYTLSDGTVVRYGIDVFSSAHEK